MEKKILDNFKKPIFFLEDHFPIVGGFLIKILRDVRFIFYKTLFLLRKNQMKNTNIFRIHYIDPQMIQYCYYCNREKFNVFTDRGIIKGGNWDISDKKFSDIETYQGLKERFVEHKEWRETKFYNDILKRINQGEIMWRCRNKEQWEARLKLIDALYESVKTKGYYLHINQRDIQLDTYQGKADKRYERIDEVLVSIGRNGRLLFNNSAHRLAIAKILKLSKIPIMVLMRHKDWVDFRNKLKFHAKLQGGKLYQPAYHFDLSGIPFTHSPERFELIKNNTSLSKGKILDIGANLGYFCHCFEQLGFNCYAVEINPQDVYFMRKLRDANGDQFEIIQQSIFDYRKRDILSFDIVLALNIFHHFLKRKTTYEKLIRLLKRFRIKELYLETHNPHEEQMKKAYKNYSPKEFVEFVIGNSCLNESKLIGKLEGGRFLYKLYK